MPPMIINRGKTFRASIVISWRKISIFFSFLVFVFHFINKSILQKFKMLILHKVKVLGLEL